MFPACRWLCSSSNKISCTCFRSFRRSICWNTNRSLSMAAMYACLVASGAPWRTVTRMPPKSHSASEQHNSVMRTVRFVVGCRSFVWPKKKRATWTTSTLDVSDATGTPPLRYSLWIMNAGTGHDQPVLICPFHLQAKNAKCTVQLYACEGFQVVRPESSLFFRRNVIRRWRIAT